MAKLRTTPEYVWHLRGTTQALKRGTAGQAGITSSTLKGWNKDLRRVGNESVLAVTCGFRFEVRSEDEVVELVADHRTVHVCLDCLTLLMVHRRVHHMKMEKVIVEMAEPRPVLAKA